MATRPMDWISSPSAAALAGERQPHDEQQVAAGSSVCPSIVSGPRRLYRASEVVSSP